MPRSISVRLAYTDACALRALALHKVSDLERWLRVCGEAATAAERQMFNDFIGQLRNSVDRLDVALKK